MDEDVIECYDNFNAKGCPDELLFGDFHDQPIPPGYYDFLNDNNYDDNYTPKTPVGGFFTGGGWVEYSSVKNSPDADDYN